MTVIYQRTGKKADSEYACENMSRLCLTGVLMSAEKGMKKDRS